MIGPLAQAQATHSGDQSTPANSTTRFASFSRTRRKASQSWGFFRTKAHHPAEGRAAVHLGPGARVRASPAGRD